MEQVDWTTVLITVAPLIIAVLKQSGFTKRQNSLIALGTCLVVAIVDVAVMGIVDPNEVARAVLATLTGAFATYKMVFQPFGFDDWLTNKTSLVKK